MKATRVPIPLLLQSWIAFPFAAFVVLGFAASAHAQRMPQPPRIFETRAGCEAFQREVGDYVDHLRRQKEECGERISRQCQNSVACLQRNACNGCWPFRTSCGVSGFAQYEACRGVVEAYECTQKALYDQVNECFQLVSRHQEREAQAARKAEEQRLQEQANKRRQEEQQKRAERDAEYKKELHAKQQEEARHREAEAKAQSDKRWNDVKQTAKDAAAKIGDWRTRAQEDEKNRLADAKRGKNPQGEPKSQNPVDAAFSALANQGHADNLVGIAKVPLDPKRNLDLDPKDLAGGYAVERIQDGSLEAIRGNISETFDSLDKSLSDVSKRQSPSDPARITRTPGRQSGSVSPLEADASGDPPASAERPVALPTTSMEFDALLAKSRLAGGGGETGNTGSNGSSGGNGNGGSSGNTAVSPAGDAPATAPTTSSSSPSELAGTSTTSRAGLSVTPSWLTSSRSTASGVVVRSVSTGSFAERAGIQSGDRIVAVGGTPVDSLSELERHLGAGATGSVQVTVERDGVRKTWTLRTR